MHKRPRGPARDSSGGPMRDERETAGYTLSAVASHPPKQTSPLFEPIQLRGVRVANRIVKSAMAEGRCDESGRPGPGLAAMYERWSAGGVGLAITGMCHVRRGHSYTGHEIGLYDDALIEPLRRVTDAVHRHDGRIFAQLCHAPPQLPRHRARALGARAPSPGFNKTNLLWDRAITDLDALVEDFARAARRARDAGFDGIQIHAAHGYLISRMLSPRFNRRTDRWGGDLEGRSRLLREVCEAIRATVDLPMLVKLNAHDGQAGGLVVEDSLEVGRRLADWGVDGVEISAGTGDVGLGFYPNRGDIPIDLGKRFLVENFPFLRPFGPALGPFIRVARRRVRIREEGWFTDLARRFADELPIPVIAVGGIRSRTQAEQLLSTSKVAMVALARPLVRQPALVRRWQEGLDRASCTSCNRCFVQIGLGRPLQCYRE